MICERPGCGKELTDFRLKAASMVFCSGSCYDTYFDIDPKIREARQAGYGGKQHVSDFEPHFDHAIGQWVTSYSDKEKKGKQFRSDKHPNGFVMLNDNKAQLKSFKSDLKNREEIIAETYAKDGIKYPKGQKVYWDKTRRGFVSQRTREPVHARKYF